MRERTALHGGELTVGPGPDGGVEVVATLPVEAVPGVAAQEDGDPAETQRRHHGRSPTRVKVP
jgi:hypothetical protein